MGRGAGLHIARLQAHLLPASRLAGSGTWRRGVRQVSVLLAATLAFFPLTGGSNSPFPSPTNPDPPYLTKTSPSDGAMSVPLDVLIDVRFSTAMVRDNTFVFIVPSVSMTRIWIDDLRVWLTHDPFEPCTTYRLWADGYSIFGESLLIGNGIPGAPNPWSFTTTCPAFVITQTDPADGETDVPVAGQAMGQDVQPIILWFSRAVNRETFRYTLTPSIPLTPVWSNGSGFVTLRHDDVFFEDCALHTVTVTAEDTSGNPLSNITESKANPWTFTTVCIPPRIVNTNPANGATEVEWGAPIAVTFSKPMNKASVNWSLSPDVGFPFDSNWTNGDRVLTLTHAIAFPASVTIAVNITGEDTKGMLLVPGLAPNPWSFTTTATISTPTSLRISRTPPDITLMWQAVPGATSYVVYSSEDRFAPWPWLRLSEVPSPNYVHRGAHEDGATHYYIVRAKAWSITGEQLSGNSTMAVKAGLSFAFDEARTNVCWMSLPYRTMYETASDISDELTSQRIDVVGRWDAASERTTLWYYFRGMWRGTDFPLATGDGFFIGIVSSFEWVLNGTDAEVTRTFSSSPGANVDFAALPFTSAYATASDLVFAIEGNPSSATRISEIARWDPITQRFEVYSWSPQGWGGSDFSLMLGEAVRFIVATMFTWTPKLVTPEIP